ncbi:MAG TPA: hypothetical protein VD994_01990, partial [Prosthecobacter sp.]|nr:hypothetical protein [Prosthecobacter sp.]
PRLSWAPATGLFATTATISTPDAARPGKSISRSLTGQSLWIPHLRKTVGQFTLPQLADPAASPPTTATSSPSLRPGHYRPGRGCALILRFAASPAGAGSGLRGVEGFNRFSSVRSSMRNCR